MNKNIICIILVIVLLLATGGILYHKTNMDAETEQAVTESEIIEISVDEVEGITKEEAEELCYFVMGEKDEETGYIFSFGTSGAVKKGKKQYYVIRASWLVDNSHLSYIGDFFVSADGKEIYNGYVSPDEYSMQDIIWSK